MSQARSLSRPLTGLILALTLAACTPSGIEGKYYNTATGEFAMELKGGKVISMQGQESGDLTYEVKGDSLVIHAGPNGFVNGMTFGIEKDGTLSLGILGSLTRKPK